MTIATRTLTNHRPAWLAGPTPTARFGLLVDLRLVEVANALGLNFSLAALRTVASAGVILGCGIVFCASVVGSVLASDLFGLDSLSHGLVMVLLLMTYSGIGALLAELLSRYRYSVSAHAAKALFRALDVPATSVFLVYAGPRIAGPAVTGTLVGGGSAFGLTISGTIGAVPVAPSLVWSALVCVPAALGLVTLAVGLRLAALPPGVVPRVVTVLALGVVAGGVIGTSAVSLLVMPLLNGGSTPSLHVATAITIGGLASPLMLVIGLTSFAVLWRALGTRSFRLSPIWSPAYRLKRQGQDLFACAGMLFTQRLCGWRFRIEIRIAGGLVGVITVLLAARLLGVPALSSWVTADILSTLLLPSMGFAAMMLGLTVSELVLGDLGPYAYGPHLRAAVENGVSMRLVLASQTVALALPVAGLGLLFAIAVSLAVGHFVALPFVVGVATLGAAIIAQHILPPPRAVDGSPTENLLTGVATLVLAAIPVAIPLTFPTTACWFSAIAAIFLAGGAIECLHRHLIKMS